MIQRFIKEYAPYSLFTLFIGANFIIITILMFFCFWIYPFLFPELYPTPPQVLEPIILTWLQSIAALSIIYILFGIVRLGYEKSKKTKASSKLKAKSILIRGVISLGLSIVGYFVCANVLYLLNHF